MQVIADTGSIYANYDADDGFHEPMHALVERYSGEILIPSPLIVEIDYLLGKMLGVEAEVDFVRDLLNGVFRLQPVEKGLLGRCSELMSQYRDLHLGLADTLVMATAERLRVRRVMTVDQRHFRAVKLRMPLHLLPFDES